MVAAPSNSGSGPGTARHQPQKRDLAQADLAPVDPPARRDLSSEQERLAAKRAALTGPQGRFGALSQNGYGLHTAL